MSDVIEWILRRAGFLQDGDRIVKVKSRIPWWDGHYVCWPTYLMDSRCGSRSTNSPCWRWKDAWHIVRPERSAQAANIDQGAQCTDPACGARGLYGHGCHE